jgi:hypothetical protein
MSLIRNAHAFMLSELPKGHTLCSQVQGSDLPAGARNDRHELLTQHANARMGNRRARAAL